MQFSDLDIWKIMFFYKIKFFEKKSQKSCFLLKFAMFINPKFIKIGIKM